ncbi:MAG: MFS transporter, partial [Actinomycetia bacterium]|nr:MFS transporter [Actinomycetes bacterium]
VGAAGGLGGYFPPLVMGATYDSIGHGYTLGLTLLAVVALATFVYTQVAMRAPDRRKT